MLRRTAATRLRKLFPVLTLTLVSAGVVLVPSAAGTLAASADCSATYSVAISNQDPASWPPGAAGSFTLSFTNTSTGCESTSIGSLRISVPAEWTVTGASAPGWSVASSLPVASGGTLDLAASSGTDEIAEGNTLPVSVTASASCDAVGGSWSSSGWDGNDFTTGPFTTADSPSINFDGEVACHLEYITGREPATAEKNVHISSVAGHPNGQAVRVGAFSGSMLLTSFTGNITLAIGTNPGPGTLSPAAVSTTGVTADDGVATFSQAALGSALSINVSSEGYTLVASAADFESATSDPFDIVDTFVDCVAHSCAGQSSSGGSTGQIDANGGGASFLTVSILSAGSFDCAGYQEITGLISWKTDSAGNQVGTITANKTLVKKLRPPDRGAAHFQVCFRLDPGKTPFLSRDGVTFITSTQEGLLPDCTSPTATNCVFSRKKTASGDAVVKFRVADGKGRI
jgi:hypothetical protein